jgi:predicted aspartyl protease
MDVIPAFARAADSTDSTSNPFGILVTHYGYEAVDLAPYEQAANLYTLEAMFGSQSVRLLLDSGFNGALTIVKSQAEMLGIQGTPAGEVEGAAGTSRYDTTHVQQVAIGSARFGPLGVSISPFRVADGAIGASFLAWSNAVLDYSTNRLYLQSGPPGHAPPPVGLERDGDIVIPLTRAADERKGVTGYFVKVMVNSTPVSLLIDTGWNAPLVLDGQRTTALGLGAEDGVRVRVNIGDLRADGVQLTSFDLSRMAQKSREHGFPEIEGILGASFLKDHNAIFDFGRGLLYLRGK